MNAEELTTILSIDGVGQADTVERIFCCAVLRHCSTYVTHSILEDYNNMKNLIEGRTEVWTPKP